MGPISPGQARHDRSRPHHQHSGAAGKDVFAVQVRALEQSRWSIFFLGLSFLSQSPSIEIFFCLGNKNPEKIPFGRWFPRRVCCLLLFFSTLIYASSLHRPSFPLLFFPPQTFDGSSYYVRKFGTEDENIGHPFLVALFSFPNSTFFISPCDSGASSRCNCNFGKISCGAHH